MLTVFLYARGRDPGHFGIMRACLCDIVQMIERLRRSCKSTSRVITERLGIAPVFWRIKTD